MATKCGQPLTQFYIYENLNLVCDRVFNKEQVTIGSSRQADLFLDHKSVADIHALVHFQNDQIFLTNKFPQNGLRLNGRSVGLAELQPEDVIDIGPFSLKFKIPADEPEAQVEEETTYAVRLVNRYGSSQAMQTAAAQLAKMMHAAPEKALELLSKEHFVLKKGLSGLEAARVQNALLKAGVVCDVQVEDTQPSRLTPAAAEAAEPSVPTPAAAQAKEPSAPEPVEIEPQPPESSRVEPAPSMVADDIAPSTVEEQTISVSFTEIYEDEQDEEEEEIWEAPFRLKTKLDSASQPIQGVQRLPEQLQVVKTIGAAVVDVSFLQGRQKYYIHTDRGRFCLVNARYGGDGFINIQSEFNGYIQTPEGVTKADLDGYKTDEYKFRNKASHFRIPLPDEDVVVVEANGAAYRIAPVHSNPSPQVEAIKPKSDLSWRHWASSAGLHLFMLLCIGVYAFLQAAAPKTPEPHFVKIDPSMLQQMQKPKVPPKPKAPPPPKPEPKKVAQKIKPQKKKPVKKKAPTTKVAKSKRAKKKVARSAPVSKSPKAGGGFGEGNIKNRNINQTGILSVLGSSTIGGPSQAIASVTNLDAVTVPGASKKNFSVGGLKGALGNGKISVATGQIMQTKGSNQVLRSAGARGKGTVAALERGTTGKKQVQAMVTAKVDRSVKIEGGMSREMVKRVIDQHLEEITYCYETALMSNPSILGRIVFEWKILMSGRVGEIRIVASSVNSHQIHDCIKTAIKSWQFPKPVGAEVVVSYPFVFDLVTF